MAETKKAAPKKTTSRAKPKSKTVEKVTIDGVNYALNELSDAAKTQLANVQATDRHIQELEAELAIAQTARAAYADTLKITLGKTVATETDTKH
jgi:transcription elongation GreA/GreB family factor